MKAELESLNGEGERAAFVRALANDEPHELQDWLTAHRLDASLVAWLVAQGVAPLAFHRLREAALLAECAPDAAALLRKEYYASAAHHALLSAALRDLLAALEPLGIRPVVLKGMALGSTLYPAPATRPVSDLDLLFERSQIPAVQQVLLRQGYRDILSLGINDHLAYPSHLNVERDLGNGQVVMIEAHWELVHDPGYMQHLNAREWLSRARPAALGESPAWVLEPADQLLYACAHMLLGHNQNQRLIWLFDLRLLVQRCGAAWDWAGLVERAAALHLAAALRYWLSQAEGWFGAFLPAGARQALASVSPASDEARYLAAAQAGDLPIWASYWQHMSGAAGWRGRLRYVRETFFPPWAYMQHRYGARSRWLAPAYYGWRFIRAGLVAFRRSR